MATSLTDEAPPDRRSRLRRKLHRDQSSLARDVSQFGRSDGRGYGRFTPDS